MSHPDDEERALRSVAIQNASSILAARRRVEQELLRAKEELERRSDELARSLSITRATLEATTDGILVTDEAGRVTVYNENYVRLWRIPGDVMERSEHHAIVEVVSSQLADPDGFRRRVAEIQRDAPPETHDQLELADGRTFERFSRIQVVEEKTVGRVWSVRDITERRRAERDHAYSSAIVASLADAVVSKTLEGVITSWNEAAEQIFGYSAVEAIGRPITMIVPPERIEEEIALLDQVRRGLKVDRFETVRLTRDGRRIHVALTISPVKDASGRIIGASKIARDVSERDQLLAREQAARTRAEVANRLKDEFLATVSHELRTPLNAILGWAQILRSGDLDPAKTRHAIEVVERNARTQAQVIEDLLDVSRIITGKLRLNVRAVMPATVVESALDSVKPTADAKTVKIYAVLDPNAGPISADSGRIQQIVWNLLSNAIKFTPKGGRVEVRLERVNSHVEIVVSDNGEGISEEFLPHVFDRFRQADSTSSRTTSGLGLGLAIVRHLVELHGGSVTAESPGRGLGAKFIVKLPLRAIHTEPEDIERVHPQVERENSFVTLANAPSLRGVRVLIVDDEPDTRELLREVLEQCGADVSHAGSASEALENLRKSRPDVIVSDIGLPGEDGYALIRKVREWERESGMRIPAVALTAYARSEDRMRALVAGYQVHVAKPIEPMELALVVAGMVQPVPEA